MALYLDGLTMAERTVIVALGLTVDGTKVPPGLWQGSTENTTVCTESLQNLLDRGLPIRGTLLCVINGGKALRPARAAERVRRRRAGTALPGPQAQEPARPSVGESLQLHPSLPA